MKSELVGLVLAAATGAFVLPAAACLGSSSPASPSDSGSSSGGSGGGSSSGNASSSGSSGGGDDSGAEAGGATEVPLVPSGTGYIDDATLGIVGSWYAYGDSWGPSGGPPGNCESVGMHPASACSSITSPQPSVATDAGAAAGFPPNASGAMCLSGTAAQIVGTPPDYSNMFGIGIGLDFNNSGGTKLPYDANTHHVVGFRFTLNGLPAAPATVRVEFPFPGTDTSGDAYAETVAPGTTEMTVRWSDAAFGPSFTPPMGTTEPQFDPSKVESIQFHVVTNTHASIPVQDLCVSNLVALVAK